MDEYKMIIAGLIGSIFTIIIKAIIDAYSESEKYKRELRKLVFQRKTDAVEKAMSWYQETIDCWTMMQSAYREINAEYNPITMAKLHSSLMQATKLYEQTSSRLNQIYLYYDFTDVEEIFKASESTEKINSTLTRIGELDQKAYSYRALGKDDNSYEIKELQMEAIKLLKWMPEYIDSQISHIAEIQNILRSEYCKYIEYKATFR